MLDINKIRRVKKVLSAQKGTQIPKYHLGQKFNHINDKYYIDGREVDETTYNVEYQKSQEALSLFGPSDLNDRINLTKISLQNPVEAVINNNEQKQREQLAETIQIQLNAGLPSTTTPSTGLIPLAKVETPTPPNLGPVLEAGKAQLASIEKDIKNSKVTIPKPVGMRENVGAGGDTGDNPGIMKLGLSDFKGMSAGDKGAAIGQIGNTMGTFDKMLYSKLAANDTAQVQQANAAYDLVADTVSQAGPYGQIIGGAMKAASFVNNTLQEFADTGTDQMTGMDRFMDSSWGMLTGVGWINGLAGKKTEKFSIDKDLVEQIGGSYGGSVGTMNDAMSKAGKKYGLFSSNQRRKANDQIREVKRQQGIMQGINQEAQDRKNISTAMSDINHLSYGYNLSGGYDLRYNRAAKHGMKFDTPWEPTIEEPFVVNLVELDDISSFKEGGNINGTIDLQEKAFVPTLSEFKEGGKTQEIEILDTGTTLKSVIPDGALHKNKHHMENAEDLTKKGIPVIDNNGELQAEIELNEIIFTLEVTLLLEKLYKSYYHYDTSEKEKTELATEAGKLLWHEIMHNTIDNTGLIDTLKKGGVLKAQNGIKTETNELRGQRLRKIALKLNPNFIQRLANNDLRGIKTPNGELGSVMISSGDKYVYPQIQEINGELLYLPDDKYIDSAWNNNDKLEFENEDDAIWFGNNYKKYVFPEYFEAWDKKYNSYKQGGTLNQSEIDNMVRLVLAHILLGK